MKFVYRFLLFFFTAFLCLAAGLFVGVRYFNQIKAANIIPIEETSAPVYEPLLIEEAQSNEVAVVMPVLVNGDTLYILEEYDITNDATQRLQLDMPAGYIGKSREAVGELVERYNLNPTRQDQLKDFVSQSLIYFSADHIIVRKSYHLPGKDVNEDAQTKDLPVTGFYVTVIDNEVVSYEADKRTVHGRPGILVTDLPTDIAEKIKDWLYFETQEALEEYLRGLGNLMESLTS